MDGLYEAWEQGYKAPEAENTILAFTSLPEEAKQALVMTEYERWKPGYASLINSMVIDPSRLSIVDRVARKIISIKDQYTNVSKVTGIPWQVIACMHHLEGNSNFSTHLANGDSLQHKTIQVPRGRIPDKDPPYEWDEAALDCLRYEKFDQIKDWSLTRCAYVFELMNGKGYRQHGINSPYLWSFSSNYSHGKYIRDGVWDSNAVSGQIGAMVLLSRIYALDLTGTQIIAGSRKLTLNNRIRAAATATIGAYTSMFQLNMLPDWISQYKAFGLTSSELMLFGVVVLFFVGGAFYENYAKQDYKAGDYTPSQAKENTMSVETKL